MNKMIKAKIKRAKTCFVWCPIAALGDGTYIRTTKAEMIRILETCHEREESALNNDLRLNADGYLYLN